MASISTSSKMSIFISKHEGIYVSLSKSSICALQVLMMVVTKSRINFQQISINYVRAVQCLSCSLYIQCHCQQKLFIPYLGNLKVFNHASHTLHYPAYRILT